MSNLKLPKRSSPCPCHSGQAYGDCCQPFHKGEREAPTPEALMRSRFSAFATSQVDYLVRTIHPDHDERKLPDDVLRPMIQASCRAYRYTGLEVEATSSEGDHGSVTFFAKVFEKGVDHSFREVSTFGRTADGWRYLSGQTVAGDEVSRAARKGVPNR
jgi:SEC-C motif domain protein